MENVTFNVTVHFANGVTVEREVPLSKAAKLAMKENMLMTGEEVVEIRGKNDTLIIPLSMTFVINESPNFRQVNKVSRYMLYKRDEGKCAYCGQFLMPREATIDHIVPKSQGGETTWENVALACSKCNCKKDNRRPEEAGMPLLIKPYNPKKVSKK